MSLQPEIYTFTNLNLNSIKIYDNSKLKNYSDYATLNTELKSGASYFTQRTRGGENSQLFVLYLSNTPTCYCITDKHGRIVLLGRNYDFTMTTNNVRNCYNLVIFIFAYFGVTSITVYEPSENGYHWWNKNFKIVEEDTMDEMFPEYIKIKIKDRENKFVINNKTNTIMLVQVYGGKNSKRHTKRRRANKKTIKALLSQKLLKLK